jgi:HD-like signal output (HDOD) protein
MMTALIGLAVLAALGAAALWLWSRASDAPTGPSPTPGDVAVARRVVARVGAISNGPAEPVVPAVPVPAELASFQILPAAQLPGERRNAYILTFRDVPRPSRLMHELLSPELIHEASSAQLADLIRPEPLLVAQILAAVNSPVYGLDRPVSGIDQAIMVLGVDRVRTLCLKYLLAASFKSDRPECQRLLDTVWAASALASEMAQHLSLSLALDRRGELVSAVVLSFLGRLATVAGTPANVLAGIPPRDLLARKTAEQRRLGLSASEIGRLLTTEWGLPADVTTDAADLDLVILGRASGLGTQRFQRLGLGYLCARLGERLAHRELDQLTHFDLLTDSSAELFHLRHVLDTATLARWSALLKEPRLGEALARLRPAAPATPAKAPEGITV